ncbi:hypothetical protein [Nocardioides sp. AX2bis]|uniref:hypothetical protein n=1 Tax=Nocardioides sp. AX2bis TaxID=2653157 RepID=UPI0012F29693|nr:hypothetical protein [Nocardioides sp. AX2bis]VXB45390.1 hypothetical protein NOCARDAX2BIS_220168 [Nocardioides sp. AX2bis]
MTREEDGHEYVTEKMNVTRRKDSTYSKSRVKPGEASPLTRSANGELGQVTLSPVDDDDDETATYPDPVYVYVETETPRRTEEQLSREEFAGIIVRALLEMAIEHGTPHAKRLWIEKLQPAIKARVERRRERRVLRRLRRAEKKNTVVEATTIEPTHDIAVVANEFKLDMTNSEAQARYLMALAAQRFADEQMQLIADADIRADDGYRELEQALSSLPPKQVASMLQKVETNPELLAGDVLTGLGMVLGVERASGPLAIKERHES